MVTETRYMRYDTHVVNNVSANKLLTEQSETKDVTMKSELGSLTVYWGIKVYKIDIDGTPTLLSGDTPVAQVYRSTDGEGLQSYTWDCPERELVGTDAILIEVYAKLGTGSWTLQKSFITLQLEAIILSGVQWTIYYHTKRLYIAGFNTTSGTFSFGTLTYNSRIENFQYSTVSEPIVTTQDATEIGRD